MNSFRDSIDIAREKRTTSEMASPDDELTSNAASPQAEPVASPVSLTSYDGQRASFRTSTSSLRADEPLRSRASSLSSALSESELQ